MPGLRKNCRYTFAIESDIIYKEFQKIAKNFNCILNYLSHKPTGKKGDCNMKKKDSRLTINDLYIGMEIKDKNQLSNIYDVWILLVKNKNSEGYTVQFIGKETNAESDKLFAQGNVVCPVYNDSLELEGDIYYEE